MKLIEDDHITEVEFVSLSVGDVFYIVPATDKKIVCIKTKEVYTKIDVDNNDLECVSNACILYSGVSQDDCGYIGSFDEEDKVVPCPLAAIRI